MTDYQQMLDKFLALIYFDYCKKNAESFDAELAKAKNKQGILMKFKHSISPKAWADDWSQDESMGKAWWLGARAYECEIRDKLISMQ